MIKNANKILNPIAIWRVAAAPLNRQKSAQPILFPQTPPLN